MLKEKSMFQAAVDVGIDKYFDSKNQINNFMYKTFLKVKADPEKYGVLPETVMEVDEAMARRNIGVTKRKAELLEDDQHDKISNIKEADIRQIVTIGRNKAAILMDRKMDMLLKSKKALAKENIVSLAKVFGIYFDKGQIVRGEATEHIAVLSRVDSNITPEQAMEELIKARERTMETKG